MSAQSILLLVEDPNWKKTRGLAPRLRRAAVAALAQSGIKGERALTILLADNKKLRRLNRNFRGKDKPTNVLSFPSMFGPEQKTIGKPGKSAALLLADAPYLGDVAIAYGVT